MPPFAAGTHIDLHPDGGPVRQYSLCNDSAETHRYQIAVLRDPASRGGSLAMHALEVGQTLRISDPKNHFPLAPHARHSVLLAGGIGITPILCMAERLWHTGRPVRAALCDATVRGYLPTACHYQLLVDNILDLTHADYLHAGSLGSGALSRCRPQVEEPSDRSVRVSWISSGDYAPPAFDSQLRRQGRPNALSCSARWSRPRCCSRSPRSTPIPSTQRPWR